MVAASDVTPLSEQGCPYCRQFWVGPSDQPKLIGVVENSGAEFCRCDICGTYWQAGYTYPHAVSRQRVVAALPWLDAG